MREPKYLLSRIPTAVGVAWVDTNDITKIYDVEPQEVLHPAGAIIFKSIIEFDNGTVLKCPMTADDFVNKFMHINHAERGKEPEGGSDHSESNA